MQMQLASNTLLDAGEYTYVKIQIGSPDTYYKSYLPIMVMINPDPARLLALANFWIHMALNIMNQSQFFVADGNYPQNLLFNSLMGVGAKQAKVLQLNKSLTTQFGMLPCGSGPQYI